jgi:hypothetical protein
MTAEVDIANRALSAIGTRSQIAALTEASNEANQVNLLLDPLRDELLRLAPWGCATNYANLTLLCAAPGTPENPTASPAVWSKGIPPPGWAYEYEYPSDCLRALWIVPQFATGFTSGVPITTAVTGSAVSFWNGPPVKFRIAIDQITDGVPAVGGADTKVILTSQEQAILCYVKQVINPDIWDSQFQQALVAGLAARLIMALIGDKGLANQKLVEANGYITLARQGDGNEGLTVNDVTPDFIRQRGIAYSGDGYSPNNMFDWGPMLTLY